MGITIKDTGADPGFDGDINIYRAPGYKTQAWFNLSRRVVFINGMLNDENDHATAARALSMTQACPVIGIYNKSQSGLADFGQCITDKLTLVQPIPGSLGAWISAVDSAYADAKNANPTLKKVDFVEKLIDGNKATVAMYRYFTSLSQIERAQLKVFCHSQGNLITSNALTATQLALGRNSIDQMEVNSYGSPCRYWPSEIKHSNFAFTLDPVALLDLRMGFSTSKVGFVGAAGIPLELDPMYAHAFLRYMDYDAEFVVNRFRWGSFGVTANMDEKGLADFLVGQTGNTRRIKLIFERLKTGHWTDSDDVAHIYVEKMRTRHDAQMRQHAGNDRGLVTLLIELLESGWTTGGERKEIDYLKTLI